MDEQLLTEKEAARLTGLSVAWFQRKRWAGDGPPFLKFQHAVRYRRSDLLAWLDQHSGYQSTSQYGTRKRV